MSAKVAILVGVSGVGKSTFLKMLSRELEFQHLSAGELIEREKKRIAHTVDYDSLRFQDISDNQNKLISGFNREKDPMANLILLDGHTVIDTGNGIEPIPTKIFESLGIGFFVFLKAEPSQIIRQRTIDASRERPNLNIVEIEQQQNISLSLTKEIADKLSTPLEVMTAEQFTQAVLSLKKWSAS
jgi:adenylate kinase